MGLSGKALNCIQDSLNLLLNQAKDFIDINGRYGHTLYGDPETPLFIALHVQVQPHWLPQTIEVLLHHGSDIMHSNRLGQTALHLVFDGSYFTNLDGIKRALCSLVKAGANLYAQDSKGLTPSHYASYRCLKYWADFRGQINSKLELLRIWKEALTTCGYNATEVVENSVGVEIAESGWELDESSDSDSSEESGSELADSDVDEDMDEDEEDEDEEKEEQEEEQDDFGMQR